MGESMCELVRCHAILHCERLVIRACSRTRLRSHYRNSLCSNSSEIGPLVPSLKGKVKKKAVQLRCLTRMQRGSIHPRICKTTEHKTALLIEYGTPARSIWFEPGSTGGYLRGPPAALSSGVKEGFNIDAVAKAIASSSNKLSFPTSDAGTSSTLLLC